MRVGLGLCRVVVCVVRVWMERCLDRSRLGIESLYVLATGRLYVP